MKEFTFITSELFLVWRSTLIFEETKANDIYLFSSFYYLFHYASGKGRKKQTQNRSFDLFGVASSTRFISFENNRAVKWVGQRWRVPRRWVCLFFLSNIERGNVLKFGTRNQNWILQFVQLPLLWTSKCISVERKTTDFWWDGEQLQSRHCTQPTFAPILITLPKTRSRWHSASMHSIKQNKTS